MTIKNVLAVLSENNIRLGLEGDDQLKIRAAKGAITPDIKQLLVDNKPALIEWIKQKNSSSQQAEAIRPRDRDAELCLSFAQKRLWFIDQLDPQSSAYNIPSAALLRGYLKLELIQRAFDTVIQRHEILRTTFANVNGVPQQLIHERIPCPVSVEDYPCEDVDTAVARLAREEATRPFSLIAGPLLRVRIVRLNPDRPNIEALHLLIVNLHHIVTDGWSNGVLLNEVISLYDAFKQGQESPLPPLPIQYADYAIWQQQYLNETVLNDKITYWKTQLADVPVLELPLDHPRPAQRSGKGQQLNFSVDADTCGKLTRLAKQQGYTLFTALMAAYQCLLYRYTGQSDFAVGSPSANRNRAELAPLIGFFVNTLAIRADLSGAPDFITLMQRVHDTMLEANNHQDVPFESIVEALGLSRDMSVTPVFQTLLVLQNTPMAQNQNIAGLGIEAVSTDSQSSKCDLSFNITEVAGALQVTVEYDTDILDQTSIEALGRHFITLLNSIVTDPGRSVDELELLEADELRQVLYDWNPAPSDYPRDTSLGSLFEQQVQLHGDRIALDFSDRSLNYRQLDQRVNQLCQLLAARGVQRGDIVAVSLDRSVELVCNLLAIIKLGAAYLPLDPEYPQDRLQFMLEDTQATLVITRSDHAAAIESLQLPQQLTLLLLDRSEAEIEVQPAEWTADTDNQQGELLAYVMYTSGSTGRPKGVMVPQRAITRLVRNTNYIDIQPDDALAHISNVSFDAATLEFWAALLNGARIVGIEKDVLLKRAAFEQVLRDKGVTTMFITVALFNAYAAEAPDMFSSIRELLVGGEALDPAMIRKVQAASPPTRLINAYGPTENTTFTTYYDIPPLAANTRNIPLGHPISNSSVYILDKNLRPVPAGVAGEMVTGGEGVALGYLNRDELSREKFVPDPFSPRPGALMYRTGDIGRWLHDGRLEIVGRMDDQVKIRGFRIELGEIESAISNLAGVRDNCVLALNNPDSGKYLCAYIIADQAPADEEARKIFLQQLRTELQVALPAYMQPSALMLLPRFPLTSNGKVDKRALPVPDAADLVSTEYVAPRNDDEALLARIWAEVLGMEKVGVQDDFFQLGGHSLVATQVVARIADELQLEVPLRILFESPTVEGLARFIARTREAGAVLNAPPLTALQRDGLAEDAIPLSYAQQRLWIIDQIQPNSPVYNIPLAARIKGPLQTEVLERVFNEMMRRHESLRTVFGSRDEEAWQVIQPPGEWKLATFAIDNDDKAIQKRIEAFMLAPFNLAKGPLFRAQLLALNNSDEHILLVCMHHIISDGWSLNVILQEITRLYEAYRQGQASPLPELAIQYADFAHWQRGWLQGEVLEKQISYWREQLASPSLLELPTDHPRPPQLDPRGRVLAFELDAKRTDALKTLSKNQGATLFMTLLGIFKVLLHRYSGQRDIAIGSPIANRTQTELEPLIGFFVNTLVLRSDIEPSDNFYQLLQAIRKTTLDAYQHQDVPFERLVEELRVPRSLSQTPLFQAMFVLQNAAQTPGSDSIQLGDLSLSRLQDSVQGETAVKFDLSLSMVEKNGGLEAHLDYRSSLFEEASMLRMIEHFNILVDGIISNPVQAISDIRLISDAERNHLLSTSGSAWNATQKDYPPCNALHQLIEQQVAASPDAVAVRDGNSELSYQDLNRRANQLARLLAGKGIGSDSLVGVAMERCVDMSVALLAILKAGAAYVPFDPGFPQDRLSFMQEDTAVSIMLTQSHLHANLPPASDSLDIINMDSDSTLWAGQADTDLALTADPDALFNVIFTSGSTGKPKGVMVPHRGIINRLLWMQDSYPLDGSDRVLQKTPYSFDVSVWELFWPLLTGASIVYAKPEGHKDPDYLRDLIREQGITTLHFVPSMLGIFLQTDAIEECSSIRRVFCSGEALQLDHERRFFERLSNAELHNLYGPTEASVDVSYYACSANNPYRSVPIGKPVSNTQLHILDKQLQPVPQGIVGELYIGGVQLARGYLNREELTASTFIDNPFHTEGHPSAKLYKTGDLARYLPDGNIEYIGRVDFQVKVRGLRIELGEIENALNRLDAVQESIVVAKEIAPGDMRLVAYIMNPDLNELDTSGMRAALRESLPEYMLPTAFVLIPAWPLSPNGKINRKALPEAVFGELNTVDYVEPASATEKELAALWSEVLGIDKVGLHDNFFDLGGHSLLAVKLASRTRSKFAIDIALNAIFEFATLEAMATYIDTTQWAQSDTTEASQTDLDQDREEFEL